MPGPANMTGATMYTVYHGLHPVVQTIDKNFALDEIEARIRVQVATSSETRVFVHAGVVGWHGRAIVIPGESRSGKSELVTALVQAGATYYSDEYAVLDAARVCSSVRTPNRAP